MSNLSKLRRKIDFYKDNKAFQSVSVTVLIKSQSYRLSDYLSTNPVWMQLWWMMMLRITEWSQEGEKNQNKGINCCCSCQILVRHRVKLEVNASVKVIKSSACKNRWSDPGKTPTGGLDPDRTRGGSPSEFSAEKATSLPQLGPVGPCRFTAS